MYTIKSIIPFDLLVDTDMGLIKYVQVAFEKAQTLFYPYMMTMIGPEYTKFLQYALVHRRFSNPLSAIVQEENMITCNPDRLLERLFENKKRILKLSTTTAIMNMVCKSFFISEVIHFDVLCKDNNEKDELLSRFEAYFKTNKTPATIVMGEPENIDLSNYGSIYLKDVNDISRYKHPIEGKNIIVARYTFNQEYDMEHDEYLDLPKVDVINEYTSSNEIRFIDVYADLDSSGVG